MDRLQSMRVFQQVVDEGSFAAAARSLDMSGAVVTRLLGDLEEHLGVRLLQRTTRRLALTDAGEAYLARVRHILSDIEEAHAVAQSHASDMSGVIRILSPAVFAMHVLAPLVAEFGRLHPQVVLDIHVDSPTVVPVEDYDLTLLGALQGFDSTLIARPIVSADAILVASPDYLRRFGRPLQPQDLAQHAMLRFKSAMGGHRTLHLINPLVAADAAPEAGPQELDIATRATLLSNHTDTLVQAAVDGAGIVAHSKTLLTTHLQRGDLERILAPWITGTYTLYAALPSRRFIPKRTSVFLDFMTNAIRERVRRKDLTLDGVATHY